MKRGEIRWYTFRLPDKRRPVLILTRDEIIVVPVTRTIRGLSTEKLGTVSLRLTIALPIIPSRLRRRVTEV